MPELDIHLNLRLHVSDEENTVLEEGDFEELEKRLRGQITDARTVEIVDINLAE